jgi:alpha-methylacyl-CoA racemase
MIRMSGPLDGVRIIEFAGIGPSPFAGMLLADLGATVLRLERIAPTPAVFAQDPHHDVMQRGKEIVRVDLKSNDGVELALELVRRADALIEGFRPGVMERLGLGPDECLRANPRLVYGRMTGWGQDGPLSQSAGHDINYVAASGSLGSMGRCGERPVAPLNLVGDFGGGGMLLACGVLAALHAVGAGRPGQVVDAAMVDGAALLATLFYGLRADDLWANERGTNLLDSGAPFYDVYECADGELIAVGALEPQFYAELLEVMGLDRSELPDQMDRHGWPSTKRRFEEVFRTRTRSEWLSRAKDRDACLTPVLSMDEAPLDAHAIARGAFVTVSEVTQPAPAPRFSHTPTLTPNEPRIPGEGGREVLREWGIGLGTLDDLITRRVIGAS